MTDLNMPDGPASPCVPLPDPVLEALGEIKDTLREVVKLLEAINENGRSR